MEQAEGGKRLQVVRETVRAVSRLYNTEIE